ncbi:hypothetical protein P691DRAFT_681619, partial [Macrolepiota fuliginosa MF-IS2]
HAQARNCVECIFGVVKQHFQLMTVAPEYSLDVQSKIILALCVLHNFIHIHDPDDLMEDSDLEVRDQELSQRPPAHFTSEFWHTISWDESKQADERRDEIAKAMWEQYQVYLDNCD